MQDNYSSEEEFEGPTPSENEARNTRVEEFRQRLAKWKKSHLNTLTKDTQNDQVLNVFLKDCGDLYMLLRDVLEGRGASEKLRNHAIWKQVGGTQNGFFPVRSPMDRTEMSQVVFRDLVEFPFTFNTKLVNSFPRRNSMEDAEIIPNEE